MSEPTQDQEDVISEKVEYKLAPLKIERDCVISPHLEAECEPEAETLLNPEPEPVKVFTEDPVALAQRKRMGTALDNAIKVVEEAGIYGDPDIKAALEVLRANL